MPVKSAPKNGDKVPVLKETSEEFKVNDDGFIKIELKYPVTVEGQTYNELMVRCPRVKDQRAATRIAGEKASAADIEVIMFSMLCGVPIDVIDELSISDFNVLEEAYSFF